MQIKYHNGRPVYHFDSDKERKHFEKTHKECLLIPEGCADQYEKLQFISEIKKQNRKDRVLESTCNIAEQLFTPQGISTVLSAISDFKR